MRDVDGEPTEDDGPPRAGRGGRPRTPGALELLIELYPSPGMTDSRHDDLPGHRLHAGRARAARARGGALHAASTCRSTTPWRWSIDGRIADAKSVVGLLLAELRGCASATSVAMASRRSTTSCRSRSRSSCRGWSTERGRAANTIAAYRRDLAGYTRLAGGARRSTSTTVDTPTLVDFVADRRASGRRAVERRPPAGRDAHAAPLPRRPRASGPTTRRPTSRASRCRPGCPSRSARPR